MILAFKWIIRRIERSHCLPHGEELIQVAVPDSREVQVRTSAIHPASSNNGSTELVTTSKFPCDFRSIVYTHPRFPELLCWHLPLVKLNHKLKMNTARQIWETSYFMQLRWSSFIWLCCSILAALSVIVVLPLEPRALPIGTLLWLTPIRPPRLFPIFPHTRPQRDIHSGRCRKPKALRYLDEIQLVDIKHGAKAVRRVCLEVRAVAVFRWLETWLLVVDNADLLP